MIPEEYLDHIIETFTQGEYEKEVRKAKEDFFKLTGTAFEKDSFYEERLDLFLDWYLFTRPLIKHDLSPVRLFYNQKEKSLTSEERDVYYGLTQTLHSIYQLKKIKKNMFYLTDLFSNQSIEVQEAHTVTLSEGDVFEARAIPYKGKYYFGRGFCFHPPQAKNFIIQRIKKIKSLEKEFREKLLLDLAQMRLKHDRYPHIDLKHIYSLDAKI